MPAVVALHDKFADQNLVVIAVHDGSVKSIAEMDERIAGTRQTRWFGRDLPFLIALDGDGATTAAFGITTFPTPLLIDRDGNVVRRLDVGPSVPYDNETAISKLLGVAGKRPDWQDRFAEVYSLSEITRLRFIMEDTSISAGVKIRWVQHDSLLERGRLAELLANVSRQNSLEFRRQSCAVDVWSISEE
jgi:hypothetical protein